MTSILTATRFLITMNTPRPAPLVFKSCKCGHDLTLAEWLALPSLGVMAGTELRNCPAPGCYSTLGVDVAPVRPSRRSFPPGSSVHTYASTRLP